MQRRSQVYFHGFAVNPWNLPADRPGVYMLQCLDTDKRYVGASTNIANRFVAYWGGSKQLRADLRRYGKHRFLLQPLFYLRPTEATTFGLDYYEALLIRSWKSAQLGYNVRRIAASPSNLKAAWDRDHDERAAALRTPEHRAKLAVAQHHRFERQAERDRISDSQQRRWARPGERQRMRDAIKAACADPEVRARKATLKGRKLATDGTVCRAFAPGQVLPPGWRWGKLDRRMVDGTPQRLRRKLVIKGSVWITDGTNQRRAPIDDIPPGWWRGHLPMPRT